MISAIVWRGAATISRSARVTSAALGGVAEAQRLSTVAWGESAVQQAMRSAAVARIVGLLVLRERWPDEAGIWSYRAFLEESAG